MLGSLYALLRGDPPDAVVWTADITYWMSGEQQAGRAHPVWQSERGYLELHRNLGVLPYYYYPRFWAGTAVYAPEVQTGTEQHGKRTVRRIHTSRGALSAESVYLARNSWASIDV